MIFNRVRRRGVTEQAVVIIPGEIQQGAEEGVTEQAVVIIPGDIQQGEEEGGQ